MPIIRKKPKLLLILTGISFLASGIDCMENNLMIIGILSFLVAFLNISAVFYVKKYPFTIKIALLIVNAIFAALSTYLYFLAGREKIQYGWAAVFIAHVIAIVIAYRKRKKSNIIKTGLLID
ncbi:MAG: hypothetical protein JXJ22_14305 [Bacteroidales bacterium]|nr:hypothetical protein [Bacteroidales bacterium]